jgi:hypothetical protein
MENIIHNVEVQAMNECFPRCNYCIPYRTQKFFGAALINRESGESGLHKVLRGSVHAGS